MASGAGISKARQFRSPQAPVLTDRARFMRKEPTIAERQLWAKLRGRQFLNLKFKRQIPLGHYIADFICEGHKLIIEADGRQHGQSNFDEIRDAWFKSQGFTVLRFANEDILFNIDSVLATIARELDLNY